MDQVASAIFSAMWFGIGIAVLASSYITHTPTRVTIAALCLTVGALSVQLTALRQRIKRLEARAQGEAYSPTRPV